MVSVYKNADWAKGFDVVVHDECFADVKDKAFVEGILKPHKDDGVPAVNLHCAMHCYRVQGWDEWFKFVGITSSGHGPQKPIELTYTVKDHPITKGLENWTTINEELYNNKKVWETATPLARGKQGPEDVVVAWTNTYGKVFSTTIGHNNATVADPKYLDLVTRGLLWSTGKLTDDGKPAAGYEAAKK
jgi:type 1 glutamine amidotransferase